MTDAQQIRNYFEGLCTEEDLRTILEWLNNDQADLSPLTEHMLLQWEREPGITTDAELYKPVLLSSLRQQLYPVTPVIDIVAADTPLPTSSVFRSSRYLKYGVAATIAGILFLGYQFYSYYKLRALAFEWKSISNPTASMKYCMLPDSTQVWLDPKSTLSWRMPLLEGEDRSVRLEGQAFFQVAPDKDHPFIAYSGPLVTSVLGTAFNIEAYPDEKDVRISLVNGKVSVQHGRPVELLKAGETLTLTKESAVIQKSPLKMTALTDWTGGHLIFSEVPVKVALARLATLYHFTVKYDDDVFLENSRFSTVFTREETPAQMIRNILFITPYSYRISGNEVEIFRK